MRKKINNLTDREVEVLEQVILGHSNKEIGDILFVTHHTIKAHLTSIFKKLGVQNRTLAAIKANEIGFIHHQD